MDKNTDIYHQEIPTSFSFIFYLTSFFFLAAILNNLRDKKQQQNVCLMTRIMSCRIPVLIPSLSLENFIKLVRLWVGIADRLTYAGCYRYTRFEKRVRIKTTK